MLNVKKLENFHGTKKFGKWKMRKIEKLKNEKNAKFKFPVC